jgi:glycosyltransferase involved in cell wall biosynthesis
MFLKFPCKEVRRMNILVDAGSIRPKSTGIGRFAQSSLRALAFSGEASIFALAHPSLHESLVRQYHIRTIVSNGSPLWSELELPEKIREAGIDVFFSPLFSCPVIRGARYVVTLHDVFPESHPGLCTREFISFWKKRIGPSMRSACHAVAISQWSKDMAVNLLRIAPERISIVNQSVGEHFRPIPEDRQEKVLSSHGLKPGAYIFYLGAIDPRKNLPRLIEAMGKIEEMCLAVAGGNAGEGENIEAIAAKHGVKDRVKQLGYVSDEELPTLYSGARCFAFPSLAEGFGRPCIEAMSCGVPVVASNATALPETCADAALMPCAENVSALAKALKVACHNKQKRINLIEAGLERAGQFTEKRFASDLLEAFSRALAGPKEGLWLA